MRKIKCPSCGKETKNRKVMVDKGRKIANQWYCDCGAEGIPTVD